MSNTLKLGNGKWATGKDNLLAYNDENNNFKPLPFSFSRASNATVVNEQGLIELVDSDEPRIDFKDNTKGALLLEPTRSNLITYSEDFDNASWNKNNIIVTPNDAISPDGTLNADLLNLTSLGNYIDKAGTITIGQTYTVSCYVKSAVSSNQTFVIYANANKYSGNSTATSEWQRFTHTFTADITAMSSGIYSPNLSKLYVWGFQLEQGDYATSYIPTNGSAVTRVGEVCNNGANEQVINSTEGVLYLETSALSNDLSERRFGISDGTSSNVIRVGYTNVSNRIIAVIYNGSNQAVLTHTSLDITQNSKIAVKYKENDFALWVDGVERSTDTSGSVFISNTLKSLDFNIGGGSHFYSKTKDVRIYNKALTDAELQALTTI